MPTFQVMPEKKTNRKSFEQLTRTMVILAVEKFSSSSVGSTRILSSKIAKVQLMGKEPNFNLLQMLVSTLMRFSSLSSSSIWPEKKTGFRQVSENRLKRALKVRVETRLKLNHGQL
jgi:hypothetical protein